MADDRANTQRVAVVGFGEAGRAFVAGWDFENPGSIGVFDIRQGDPDMSRSISAAGVRSGDLAATVSGADMIFCLVTADRALEAALAAAPFLRPGTLWLDCNSCAPDTKRQAAKAIESAGGRYVDVAVMAPVHPRRHLVPLLISGPHWDAAAAALVALGMQPRHVPGDVGRASSIKMIRSVMIKGLEALTAECFLSARRAGVENEVLASLEASDGDIDWRGRGAYNLERMMMHGVRRAAEMREVALTVAQLGLPNGMSAAAACWQDAIAATGADPDTGSGAADLMARADAVLKRL